jgi:hypothetical protein
MSCFEPSSGRSPNASNAYSKRHAAGLLRGLLFGNVPVCRLFVSGRKDQATIGIWIESKRCWLQSTTFTSIRCGED